MAAFPAQFAALEPYADWALPSEADRYAKRLASNMTELRSFYDTAMSLLETEAAYLMGVALDGISEEDLNLLRCFEALVTVSFPIEAWHQPYVPDSGAASIDVVVEPRP